MPEDTGLPVDVPEDEDEAEEHDEERRKNEGEGDEHRVGQRGGPVPDALVALRVEVVVAPAQEVRHLEREGGQPYDDASGNGGLGGEDLVVHGVVTDEDEAVDGGQGQGQEGAETRRQTNSSHRLAEPYFVVEPAFPLHHG